MYYMTKVEKKVEIRYKEKTFLWWLVIVNRNPNRKNYFTISSKIEIESMKWYDMKWNDMKWYEMIWNEMKWNEMKWNEMKWNEMKWNEMKWNEMKWNDI